MESTLHLRHRWPYRLKPTAQSVVSRSPNYDTHHLRKGQSVKQVGLVNLRTAFNCKLIYERVDTCKDRIAAALDTLRPTSSWERGAASGQEADTVLLGGRVFGTAMSSLIDYLSSEYDSTFA